MEENVVTGSTAGLAHQLRLDRAARNAGEAFAFIEPGAEAPSNRRLLPIGGIVLVFATLAAVAGLYLGF
jgi:hypothetical protein